MKFLTALFLFFCVRSVAQEVGPLAPVPSREQLAWHEKEFYLFIHFGPNTFTDKEWGEGTEDPSVFYPTAMDCRQWARIAKKAGAKGIILTAKHHDGFCLWPSQFSSHTVRESKWMNGKGDVVRSLSDACRQEGIEMGVYISPWDRNHPLYGTAAYNEVYLSTMKELLTRYGRFFELWWDGANGEGSNGRKQQYDFHRFEDSAFKWQPHIVIFSDIGPGVRWCGNEKGLIGSTNWNLLDTAGFQRGAGAPPADTLNQGNRNGRNWMPAEADVSIRPGWFYHAKEDDKVKTPAMLFDLYLHSVGNGGNLLLNVPPDRTGRINAADSASLMGFRLLRDQAFADNLLSQAKVTSNNNTDKDASRLTDTTNKTAWVARSSGNVVLDVHLPRETSLNTVVLQEMIAYGQRVARFTIEALDGNDFKNVYTGTTIGRKKIASFDTIHTSRLRITITEARAAPVLRHIGAYMISKNRL